MDKICRHCSKPVAEDHLHTTSTLHDTTTHVCDSCISKQLDMYRHLPADMCTSCLRVFHVHNFYEGICKNCSDLIDQSLR